MTDTETEESSEEKGKSKKQLYSQMFLFFTSQALIKRKKVSSMRYSIRDDNISFYLLKKGASGFVLSLVSNRPKGEIF